MISPEDSPKTVNNLVSGKWGVSLFRFAQVFAVSPLDLILQKNSYPLSIKDIREIKHVVGKMRADLLRGGRRIRRITEFLWDVPEDKISDVELIKEMHLEEFFSKYIHRFEVAARYLEKTSFQGGRGVGINKKSIIATGWGFFASQARRRVDWKLLSKLYEWFWCRVRPYKYYADLRPVYGLEEYLRHQYNVHRWVGGAFEYISRKLRISEGEILPFITNIFIQRIVGGREDYFRDKLPLSEAEFKRLFLNLQIEAYMVSTDGLTMFSENQALADPYFLFFRLWLAKLAGKTIINPKASESLPMGLSIKGADDPFAKTQIGDYMGIALKYFVDQKVDLSELPPLIIFPDKTCFSPRP
jgi:hypothetical protein